MKTKISTLFLSLIVASTVSAQDVSIFKDSNTGDNGYKFTWGQATDESSLELYDGDEFNGNLKLPVVTSPVYEGTHALKLHYLSADGSWIAEVKLRDEATDNAPTPRNLMGYQKISLWFLSDIKIPASVLPKVRFGDSGSLYTSEVPFAEYFTYGEEVEANTWYNIQIPLIPFQNFSFKDKVSKVQFLQHEGDERSVTLLIDEAILSKEAVGKNPDPKPSSLNEEIQNEFNVSYNNNVLTFTEAITTLDVYDTLGHAVYKKESLNDLAVTVNLAKGIYVVKTNLGSSKIIVQ